MLLLQCEQGGAIPAATAEVFWERCACSRSRVRDESMLPLQLGRGAPIPTATVEALWERCGCSRIRIRDESAPLLELEQVTPIPIAAARPSAQLCDRGREADGAGWLWWAVAISLPTCCQEGLAVVVLRRDMGREGVRVMLEGRGGGVFPSRLDRKSGV